MSISRQILLVRALVIAALLVLVLTMTSLSNSAWMAGVFVGVLLNQNIARWMVNFTWRRRCAAMFKGDFVTTRRLSADLRAYIPGKHAMADILSLEDTFMLMEEERHAEALPVLTALLRQTQTEKPAAVDRVGTLNSLAWCNAFLGELQTAEAQAMEAVELAKVHLHPLLPYCLGTLGTVLVLARRDAEALPLLETALAMGSAEPRALAIRAYYLGEALRALGREPEATAAFERTVRETPASKWAQRAREKLGRSA